MFFRGFAVDLDWLWISELFAGFGMDFVVFLWIWCGLQCRSQDLPWISLFFY